jgi:cupin fold WbuC family metalloprotein
MFSNWPQSADAIQTIGASAGGELLDVAKSAARLRTHMLLHTSHEDPVQRLLVALSRGTYIQPHRHNEQWEMIVPLKGPLALLLFSTTGVIASAAKQSILQRKERMDCFAAPVIGRAFARPVGSQ